MEEQVTLVSKTDTSIKKVPKVPHSPYPSFSQSDGEDEEEGRGPREEVLSINGKDIHVRRTTGGNCQLTILNLPENKSGMERQKNQENDQENVTIIPAVDFSSTRSTTRLVVAPAPAMRQSSSGSESYYTPPTSVPFGR
jgi:hypothetical protein